MKASNIGGSKIVLKTCYNILDKREKVTSHSRDRKMRSKNPINDWWMDSKNGNKKRKQFSSFSEEKLLWEERV
jgi:hypothetical protein